MKAPESPESALDGLQELHLPKSRTPHLQATMAITMVSLLGAKSLGNLSETRGAQCPLTQKSIPHDCGVLCMT